MTLEGTVIIAAFGAFVDIGVHQDGLVHVSQLLTASLSKICMKLWKAGDVVKVRVKPRWDAKRKRIALSMRGRRRRCSTQRDAAKNLAQTRPLAAATSGVRRVPKQESQGAFGAALLPRP